MDVPIIRQREDNWCSAATLLQVLTYFDLDGEVEGNSISDKQSQLFNNEINKGNSVDTIQKVLNSYLNLSVEYSYYVSVNYPGGPSYAVISNINDMTSRIEQSIAAGYPVMLHAMPNHNINSYYVNYPYEEGHYICLIGYDSVTNKYIVRDCNNTSASQGYPYMGEFVVTKNEIYNATSALDTRFIICKTYM
jgi:hypothetical protein